ncbi:MAG TPA: hypothetical protein PLV68_16745, partial [Ilumatobacteraceae bacterium]|nr:hypothetical protein [Ilumatobacteraceae bacterium]
MDGRGRRNHPGVARGADRGDWIERHGMAPNYGDTAGHVATIRAVSPDAYAAAHAFVEPMDAIAARLTGHVTATQHTSFSRLTVDNRRWGNVEHDAELVARVHL